MPNLSMGDYLMSNLGSGYNIGIESGSSMSLNGIADRSNPAPYGYQTENFSAKGSLSASVHDYERREAYGSYRTNQMTRGKQDYPTSTEYDAVSRMSARGPSPPTSSSLAPTSGSSKLSDTILVTNVLLRFVIYFILFYFFIINNLFFKKIYSCHRIAVGKICVILFAR
jgi:hypothetical protein